jgi:protein TonB
MPFRCVLFSSDPGTIEPVGQAFADLGIEGEHCSEAVAAVEKVCRELFQIVIVDWDKPTEAGALLTAARNRKVSERPLTVAVVSQDAAVSKALQAGATSTLRKPVQLKQITDSLSRARDLLRARESAAQAAAAGISSTAASSGPSNIPSNPSASDSGLRAGDFLQTSSPATQLDTESEMQRSIEQSAAQEINALQDLEPTASSVAQEKASPAPRSLPAPEQPRGLQWYLDQRTGKSAAAVAPAPVPSEPGGAAPAKPDLLGFDQSPSFLGKAPAKPADPGGDSAAQPAEQEKKAEAELFSYIAGEEKEKSENKRTGVRIGKGPIIIASALAACAIAAAPQAPWHPQIQKLWAHGRQSMHTWLNPQVAAPAQAPISHESFGRAGDEYKLPVAENIPDATTDPNQIKVTPMVDPTAKKPNSGATDPNLAPTDANPSDIVQNLTPVSSNPNSASPNNPAASNSTSTNPQPTSGGDSSTSSNPPASAVPSGNAQPAGGSVASPSATSAPSSDVSSPSGSTLPPTTQPAPAKPSQPHPATPYSGPPIPSSLKSQMASMTPEASGNKAPETALPSIEPVAVPEATERGLIIDQPAPGYPDSAKGQQGMVVLQVLIGRDGSVQDAKFLQGSLAFARAAIDGVRPWRFKPYVMNGRPVSVQTNLTISFVPGH